MEERHCCPYCGRKFSLDRDHRNELEALPDHNRDTSLDDGFLNLNRRIVLKPCEGSQKRPEHARQDYRQSELKRNRKRSSFWRES